MQRTLGRVVGAFTTAAMVSAVGIAGVSHQGVETGIKGHMAYTTWSDYEGSAGSAQYSALTQINKSNVAQLQQVWFYPAGNNGGGNWGGGAVDPPTGTLYIEAKNAPSMIRLEPNPPKRQMTGSPETEGRILYVQNCQSCHTAELTGQPPSIPSLVDVVSRISADRVKSTLQNGASPMPAFTSLSDKEVDALVAYLRHRPRHMYRRTSLRASPLRVLHRPPPSPRAPATRYWTGYGYMNSSEDCLPTNHRGRP